MTLGERIKAIRKAADLTQQALAVRIGIKQQSVALIEIGKRNTSDQVILSICREFNVSEDWLRTGEGEMFVPSPNGVLDELAQKYNLSSRGRIIIERFLDLKPDIQEAVANYIEEVSAAFKEGVPAPVVVFKNETTTPAPDRAGQERTEPDIMAELAELKRQNQELAAKVAAMEEEDALLGLTDVFSASPSVSVGNIRPAEKAKK